MQIAPQTRHDWLRAYFIALEFVSILACLSTRAYGDWMILNHQWEHLVDIGGIATILLLLSSSIFVFQSRHRKLAIAGFFITAFYFLGGLLLPTGGIRF
jgi:glucan phosphoethanolaminetransferase (alkaline phosphatase superfamily)